MAPSASVAYDSLAPRFEYPLTPDQLSATDAAVLNELAETSPDETGVPAFDASRVRWDIDVRSFAGHPRVQYYLKYFQGFGRSGMGTFLNRGARYERMIRQRFEAEGLPGDLGYLAVIESGYSTTAVSRAHAVGMWQFMRGTGKGYGLRIDSWVDERRDPVKATDAAARHLSDLWKRFGSLYLAAAAYNAGAGKVSRSLGKLQWDTSTAESAPEPAPVDEVPDGESDEAESVDDEVEAAPDSNDITSDAAFFRLAGADLLAAETQDYVPKLIAVALIAKQPERYGFSAPAAAPFAYDSLVVTDATGLDVIARLAETSVEEIRELNPQYLRLATPPKSEMVIRLPAGTRATVAARYTALSRSARVRFLTHVVRKHERLATIASRYHLPVADIRSANPKVKGTRPSPGTRLVIPTVAVPSALAIRAAGSHGVRGSGYAKTYRVRRGDTLIAIARRYRVTVKALRRANAIRSDYALRTGMRLRIPG
ncbi:MAG: LysM peptidoglycan-binding domain-containing protein [Gemmatimonadales bacterium]